MVDIIFSIVLKLLLTFQLSSLFLVLRFAGTAARMYIEQVINARSGRHVTGIRKIAKYRFSTKFSELAVKEIYTTSKESSILILHFVVTRLLLFFNDLWR